MAEDFGIENFSEEEKQMSYGRLITIAMDPLTPEAVLRRLATTQTLLRVLVARNIRCPLDLLLTLSEDPEDGVRRAVAQNPRTPFEVSLFIIAEIGLVGEPEHRLGDAS